MNTKIIDNKIVSESRDYISFSEIHLFSQCPYKHNQNYNLGLRDGGSFYTIFGSAIHEAIEQKWKYKNELAWLKMSKAVYLVSEAESDSSGKFPRDSEYGKTPGEWTSAALRIYKDFFVWIEKEFPDCELFDIEYELNEELENFERNFKGYIDLILYNPKEDIYHIIDLKTASWGWNRKQFSDTKKLYQVILYKNFFCKKEKIDRKKVHCHYVLLLRSPAKDQKLAVKLHSVTSGNRKIENSVTWMEETLKKIKRGIKLKTPQTCSFCSCGKKINRWNKKK